MPCHQKKKFSGSYENVSFDEKIEGLHFKDASIKQTMKELIAKTNKKIIIKTKTKNGQ